MQNIGLTPYIQLALVAFVSIVLKDGKYIQTKKRYYIVETHNPCLITPDYMHLKALDHMTSNRCTHLKLVHQN
jgi:hypothetical protein